jgi:hypothetical protein
MQVEPDAMPRTAILRGNAMHVLENLQVILGPVRVVLRLTRTFHISSQCL